MRFLVLAAATFLLVLVHGTVACLPHPTHNRVLPVERTIRRPEDHISLDLAAESNNDDDDDDDEETPPGQMRVS